MLCFRVDCVATRGHCCLRNAPRPQAVGSARRMAPGPPGQTHPSPRGLLTSQPHPHLLHLLGVCCTPSSLHTSRQSHQSAKMISILQMEEPRPPGLGPSRPQGGHRRLCLSPPHIRVSTASGSEWISSSSFCTWRVGGVGRSEGSTVGLGKEAGPEGRAGVWREDRGWQGWGLAFSLQALGGLQEL